MNLGEWAAAESRIGPNNSLVDATKLAEWTEIYANLRSEFWASEQVTPAQRQYLWFGELREKTRLLQRGQSRSSESTESTRLLAEMLDFFLEFPEPNSVEEEDAHHWMAHFLLTDVCLDADTLGLDSQNWDVFLDRLSDIGEYMQGFVETYYRDWCTAQRRFVHGESKFMREWYDAIGFKLNTANPFTSESFFVAKYYREFSSRRRRAIGPKLWMRYPDNEGRIAWLSNAIQDEPSYFADFVVGVRASARSDYSAIRGVDRSTEKRSGLKDRWHETESELLRRLQQDASVDRDSLVELFGQRLVTKALKWQAKEQVDFTDETAQHIVEALISYNSKSGASGDPFEYMTFRILVSKIRFSEANERGLWELAEEIDNEFVLPLLEGWQNQARMTNDPIEFQGETTDGELLNIVDYRGKIVLLEFWTTSCTACILEMPKIHEIYLSYRNRGFEVISVGLDVVKNRRRVDRLKRKIEWTWPTIAADDDWEMINRRFGFRDAVPQYLLLNRDGTLYAGTSEIDLGRNLRALLDEMLAAEAAEKEVATTH